VSGILGLFTGGGAAAANYIEDVFSTYLYAGNGTTQTITNGIDLSTKGGLVWVKCRSTAYQHLLWDTARSSASVDPLFSSNSGQPQSGSGKTLNYLSSGFSYNFGGVTYNGSGDNYTSWTFRKQAKFFDIVTWTGNGATSRAIPHNLGSIPGCIITKSLNTIDNWAVYHQNVAANSTASAGYTLYLDAGNSRGSLNNLSWNGTPPTSTVFTANPTYGPNTNGTNYVAYLFASNAGGFGTSGNDNVITCGTFATGSSGNISPVNLGFEPQWLLVKNIDNPEAWQIYDTMRGMSYAGYSVLYPNTTDAEYTAATVLVPTATGLVHQQGLVLLPVLLITSTSLSAVGQ